MRNCLNLFFISGVGGLTEPARFNVHIPGVLECGTPITFVGPMLTGKSAATPPLLGLNSLTTMNAYMGAHNGLMACVPYGTDNQIEWPEGTRFIQCRKSTSGHWLMMITAWESETFGKPIGVTRPERKPKQKVKFEDFSNS